jgi:hypothetical protein
MMFVQVHIVMGRRQNVTNQKVEDGEKLKNKKHEKTNT